MSRHVFIAVQIAERNLQMWAPLLRMELSLARLLIRALASVKVILGCRKVGQKFLRIG